MLADDDAQPSSAAFDTAIDFDTKNAWSIVIADDELKYKNPGLLFLDRRQRQ